MKKIIRYNPSLSTLNQGDRIIFESFKEQMLPLFDQSFCVDVSTHLPISYIYCRLLKEADYKFVCGTNLLMGRLNGIFRQWDINIFNAKALGPAILVGAGWWQYNNKPNMYTKCVYRRILSDTFLHSVRDNYTKTMLNEMGFANVINTSCPTMWKLTPEHCAGIPLKKAPDVVTTLTDYKRDIKADELLLDTLSAQYRKVYLWLQGVDDYSYLKTLRHSDKIQIVYPDLENYNLLLADNDIDYVGTRLHGGIRALQYQKRTIIIGVDNRALEKHKDFNLSVIPRQESERIGPMIDTEFETKINIPQKAIREWKAQFKL